MYFDARSAKALAPGNHIVVDACPGLRLVARDTKKTWIYRFKDPTTGLMKQTKIGSWPAIGPLDAAIKWQALRELRDAGEMPTKKSYANVTPDTEIYTLKDLVRDYADGHLDKRRKPKSALLMRQRLTKAISEHTDMSVKLVNRKFVFNFIEGFSATPVLASSIKTELGAAWSYALDAGRIDGELPNWWILVSGRKLRSKGAIRDGKHKGTAKRVLTGSEIKTLMQSDMPLFSQQVRDFLQIQLWTCTRGAEIVQMQSSQFTQEKDGLWWTIPKDLTKGMHNEAATDLRVPIVGRIIEIVQRLKLNGLEWMFPSVSRKGIIRHQQQTYMQTKVNYRQPYCKVRPDHIRQSLSVTHWSPHDLRRTGRTILASIKCPNEIGEAILGHVKPGVVGTYNLYEYDSERRDWLTLLDAHLESFITA